MAERAARGMTLARRLLLVEAVVAGLVFASVLAGLIASVPAAGIRWWTIGPVIAALLYFASHVTRAVRLGIIALPMLGVSFRSAFLLHFFVAPWSLILPLKLDEGVRIAELYRIGRSLPRAILVSLIDRSMDGVVLIALAVLLIRNGLTVTGGFIGLAGVGLTAIALGFFVLPALLEITQRHLFMHNYRDDAIQLLKGVNYLRRLLLDARETISSVFPFLVLSTIAIWGLELAAVMTLLAFAYPETFSLSASVETMLARADLSWKALVAPGNSMDPAITLLSLMFFTALALPWALFAHAYIRRSLPEPRRARIAHRSDSSRPGLTRIP